MISPFMLLEEFEDTK